MRIVPGGARGVRRAIGVFTAFLLVLLWGGLALHLTELRDKELEHAGLDAVSLSRTVAEYATRVVRAIDQSLLRLKAEYERDPAGFDIAEAVASDPFLKEVAFRVARFDENGMVASTNESKIPPRFSFGDAPWFRAIKASRDDNMSIGRPTPSPVDGRSDIRFSRRLGKPDGTFNGMITVMLNPHYFSDFFRNVDIGKKGFVSLAGLDGIVRAQIAMGGDTAVDQDLSATPLFSELGRSPMGFYRSISPPDLIPRIVGYRTLAEYPMVSAVGQAEEEILADYYGERTVLVAIAALLSLIFLAVAVLLGRQVAVQARTEELLRQRGRQLIESRNQAEHASRTKSEFLANMSHELRTPLNAIIGFSEMMIEGVMGPIGSPKYLDYAKDIHRSGAHLLDLISDILDMSKIEAGHYKLSLEEVDLAKLGEGCLRILAGRAEQRQVALINRMASDLPLLTADSRAIRQILLNLLSNAVKFTPAGGRVVLAAQWAAHGSVVVSVSDTGIGIAESDLGRIGQPFQQVEDDALNRKHEGAGLGLAITKKLVELHGGVLEIASAIGAGTTVTVRLPTAVAAPVVKAAG